MSKDKQNDIPSFVPPVRRPQEIVALRQEIERMERKILNAVPFDNWSVGTIPDPGDSPARVPREAGL